MLAVYVLLVSLFISMVLVPPLMRFADVLGLTDQPGERKIHSRTIPRTGGIAIVIGALIPVICWVPMRPDIVAFILSALVLFVFGLLDDRFNLDYRFKFVGQFVAAAIVTLAGGVLIRYVPSASIEPIPLVLSAPLTIFVLVGLTNAVNLSDGLDGLAGGISLLSIGCLGILAYQCVDLTVFMLALAIMGATFGFLRFNTSPAQVFMGDTGSQFLGFSSGVIAVMVTQRLDNAVGVMLPILILGLPILDTLNVMIRRILQGRSPFSPDRLHLHHQLIASGLNQNQAVMLIYGVQTLLVALAYLLRFSADLAVIVAYVSISIAILFSLSHLPRFMAQCASSDWMRVVQRKRLFAYLRGMRARIVKWLYRIFSAVLPLMSLAVLLTTPSVGPDMALLGGVLLIGLILALMSRWRFAQWAERLSAYVVAVAVAYYLGSLPSIDAHRDAILFGVAGFVVLIAIWMRFAWIDFRVSSLDVLILIIALSVPNLSAPMYEHFGMMALVAIVLFYVIEILFAERKRPWGLLRLSIIALLATIALRGAMT